MPTFLIPVMQAQRKYDSHLSSSRSELSPLGRLDCPISPRPLKLWGTSVPRKIAEVKRIIGKVIGANSSQARGERRGLPKSSRSFSKSRLNSSGRKAMRHPKSSPIDLSPVLQAFRGPYPQITFRRRRRSFLHYVSKPLPLNPFPSLTACISLHHLDLSCPVLRLILRRIMIRSLPVGNGRDYAQLRPCHLPAQIHPQNRSS